MKNHIRTRTKAVRIAACLAILNFAVPGGAIVSFGLPLKESAESALSKRAHDAKDLAARQKRSASRLLTTDEERRLQGRDGENPYMAGQSKLDIVYKGVDLMTANFLTSVTDMNFDGGYGIPVNVTRSYSANNIDAGPFGKGWTLSADVRSTAGGLVKSGSAPLRSIPVGFKERPSAETDPNAELANGVSAQPVEAVIATDSSGDQETVQKDIDGILTTPPWDTNVNENTQYEYVSENGKTYQVMVHNETVTVEGTRYVYDKKGTYLNGGTKPWNDTTATAQPANVMKVVSATDRQGNVTTYSYGANTFDYVKSNGTTRENPLNYVSMPGGHQISFVWGNNASLASYGRVTSVSDGAGGRTVSYAYTGAAGSGLLSSVTTPGGKTTTYGYGAPGRAARDYRTPAVSTTTLLNLITNPNGTWTSVTYQPMGGFYSQFFSRYLPLSIGVSDITTSAGQNTSFALSTGIQGTAVNLAVDGDIEAYAIDWVAGNGSYAGATKVLHVYSFNEQGLHKVWQNSENDNDESGFSTISKIDCYDNEQNNVSSVVGLGEIPREWTGGVRKLETAYLAPRVCTAIETSYNFLGQPLTKETIETNGEIYLYPSSNTVTRRAMVKYAYWGPEKYFQQKAVMDQSGRFTYTDYYPNTSPAGKRGQTYRTYDPKNGGVYLDSSAPIPVQTPPVASDKLWRYQVTAPANNYSAQYDYDTQGRPVDVWKLQKTTPAWTYEQIHTSYGADSAPTWGQANQVIEDYGSGKINRTTTTNAYTSWGKPSDVTDAAGHRFVTSFDNDGLVNSVTRADLATPQALVSYTYGSSGISFGQPTQVVDGLSGVTQSITYVANGVAQGQPSSVTETNGADSYSSTFTYNTYGDRETATYQTPSGTARWGYYDYRSVGDPANQSRAFQTLRRLDANGQPTPEEFHYTYDIFGHLLETAFAQTPAVGFTPQAGHSWYENSPASVRARAHYEYDPGGRVTLVSHFWDTWNSSNGTYSSVAVLANACDYEVSGLNRGLKTASRFYVPDTANPSNFALQRTETYGYDAQLDYLTSANYGDGNPNQTPAWTYDAAGNRNDASVVDSLNRATTLGGAAVTYDILGNRLTKSGVTYGWDALNRLTSLSGGTAASYQYRADGMRVAKVTGGVTTKYRHDAQMGIEDVETQGANTTVTRYGLGMRGVDLIERTNSTGTVTGFPIYDAHGNNVATLSRNGTSGFNVADRRAYDAWGVVRAQQSGGDPKLRYCANLGHKADDESGLIYMRARYYEPSSGRFINQDPGRRRDNWFIYCGNNPVSRFDQSGEDWTPRDLLDLGMIVVGLVTSSLAMTIFIASLKFFAWQCVPGIGQIMGIEVLLETGDAVVSIWNDAKDAGGWFGKLDKGRYRAGALAEVVGFLSAYNGMLDFMYRHMEEGMVDN